MLATRIKLDKLIGRACCRCASGQPLLIEAGAPRVQIKGTLPQLGELGEAARQREPGHRMPAEILQRAADEVAHVDQRDLRQPVQDLDRALRGAARRGRDVGEAGCTGDVDPAMDRVDPRRAAVGDHDPGRPQD